MGPIDWSRRADYIRSRHAVEPAWATEAVQDEHAVWLRPDPASITGRSIRVIGYSSSARDVLTVILVESDADPSEPADGEWWGANAWPARGRDRQLYAKEES